jgi:N-carbamoyl-L-amino-acid hydrolase
MNPVNPMNPMSPPHDARDDAAGGADPLIDADRLHAHLAALAEIGRGPDGGMMRVAYSDADKVARAVVLEWMRAAKLAPSIDAAGNIVAWRPGSDASCKPLLVGSHTDSVPNGGVYDGPLGSLAAIEVAYTLAERGVVLRHPLEVVIWQNEEGGLYGSRAVSGQLSADELRVVSSSGKTIEQGIAFLGGDPSRLSEVRRASGDVAGYLELHIEQGAVLEASRVDIGVVEGLVGIKQWDVVITGVENHAGTTPMDRRQDALLAAARFVEMVHRVVIAEPGAPRGTVGRMQAFPGAANVIPGRVACTLELRDVDDDVIDRLIARVRAEAVVIGARNGTRFEFVPGHVNPAAPTDPRMRHFVRDAAASLGLSTLPMPSGAGHDAQSLARLGPIGMIFIPSVGGISHAPAEYSTPRDIANGANVLLRALLAADRTLA